MARATLRSRLESKAEDLRTTQDVKAGAAVAFVVASENAAKESATAEKHAIAVESALDILDAAGVHL